VVQVVSFRMPIELRDVEETEFEESATTATREPKDDQVL
jgi:hypothetical protein